MSNGRIAVANNLVGAMLGIFLIVPLFFASYIEGFFWPVIDDIHTRYVSLAGGVLRFHIEFEKRRAGFGVLSSWKMDPSPLTDGGEILFTPEVCDGTGLIAGRTPTGSRGSYDMCAPIVKALTNRPFVVTGMIHYKTSAGTIIPTAIPQFEVPSE